MAPNVSLSPTAISAVAMVSFSLTTGAAPSSKSRWMVLWKLSCRPAWSMSSLVRRIWASVWLYSPNSLVVGIHEFALAHGGAGLLGGHIRGPSGEHQLADPHYADGAGRDQKSLMACIFNIAQNLLQLPPHDGYSAVQCGELG